MKSLKFFLIFFSLLLVLPGAFAQVNQCASTCVEQARLFTVTGTAEIKVKPDRVILVVGVKDQSKDLLTAKNKMNQTIQTAIAYCKAKGMMEKSIQLRSINIYPYYQNRENSGQSEFSHYNLDQKLVITLEDVDAYGEIIFNLLEMGINQVDSISFSSSEFDKYKNEARLQAIKVGQGKAKMMTEAAGLKLGEVYNVSENIEHSSYYAKNYSSNIGLVHDFSENSVPSVAVGTITFKESVTLTYRLED